MDNMAYIPGQLVSDTSSVLNDQISSSSSSSSDVSMSFSSSDDFAEDVPSTSGYSSDMTHSKKVSHRDKKDKMNCYLRELRTIVKPYCHKRGKIRTLSALEHVLNSLREQNERKIKNPGEPVELCEEGGNITYFPKLVSFDTEQLVAKPELRIVLNMKSLEVCYVSENIKETLGHSKDNWLGRLLTDFVHKSDLFTFHSCIHFQEFDSFMEDFDSDNKTPTEIPERTVFFRLMCLKNLADGFIQDKDDVYKPFKVLVRYQYLYPSTTENYMTNDYIYSTMGTSREKTALSPPSITDIDPSSRTYEVKKKYIVLDCMMLTSGYKELGQLPRERTFNTRHTTFCCYSYIVPSVTELMGYMPQEMIGSSVFDFYHPDDLNDLYKTYKTIILLNGTPFKGKPIRFRTKNGDWIVTETEWSSFINPWSKKLEFIIGQHTVIKGPKNLNVFQEAPHPRKPSSEKTLKLHRMIRDLLQKPLDIVDVSRCKKTGKMSSMRKVKQAAMSDEPLRTTEDNSSFTKDGTGNKYDVQASVQDCILRHTTCPWNKFVIKADHCHLPEHVLPKVFDETSTYMAYDHLNYTSKIERFLLSEPRIIYPKSDLNKGFSEWYNQEEYQDEVDPEFEVEIFVPKPPGITKMLVSEQERHEDPSVHSQCIERKALEKPQYLNQPFSSTSNVSMVDYPIKVTLTRETLWKHTKLQEEIYVSEAKQDRSLFDLRTDRSTIFSNCVQRKKRFRLPYNRSFIRNQVVEKAPRRCKEEMFGNVLLQPIPLDGNLSGDSTIGNIIPTHPAVIGMIVHVHPIIKEADLMHPDKNIVVTAPISLSSRSISASNNNGSGGVECPYYPVTGGTLNPHVYKPKFDFVPGLDAQ